jgi:hypothetical protein
MGPAGVGSVDLEARACRHHDSSVPHARRYGSQFTDGIQRGRANVTTDGAG